MKIKYIKYFFCLVFSILLAACFAANKNLKCNLYVIDAMKKKKVYLPHQSANNLAAYLESSPQWKKIPRTSKGKLNHKAAYNAAKSGKNVLASYSGKTKNGHIVVISAKKEPVYSKKYNAYVPYAHGSVNGNKPKLLPLSYQFSADKEPKIDYFVYE
jgi:hypothetical protein